MRTMMRIRIGKAITIIAVMLCLEALGKTGDVWTVTVKEFDARESSIEDVAHFLEQCSIDARGKDDGIRIITHQPLVCAKQKIGMRFKETTIEMVLRSCCEIMGLGYVKFYNTAVVGQPGERYFIYTVTGRCVDAVSNKPLKTFFISNEDVPWPCECTILEDGRFICSCLVKLSFNVLDGVVFFDVERFDRLIRLRISADGYESKGIAAPLFGGKDVCQEYTIQLQPVKQSGRLVVSHSQ